MSNLRVAIVGCGFIGQKRARSMPGLYPSAMPGQPAADVAAFLAACRHPLRAELDALRAIVAKADPRLVEAIKWNAPSWGLPDADDHCMTVNLGNKATLRLVLHRGAE